MTYTVGETVWIMRHAGAGGTGTVVETGIHLAWDDNGIRVRRDDGSGEGIYGEQDVRPARRRYRQKGHNWLRTQGKATT